MDEQKKKRLEAHGWKVSTVEEFLDLTPADMRYIELKLSLIERETHPEVRPADLTQGE